MTYQDRVAIKEVIKILDSITKVDSRKVYMGKINDEVVSYSPLQQAKGLAEIALDKLENSDVFEES